MIYLIRHADAVAGEDDVARPLSPKGQQQVARICVLLGKMEDFHPAEVWHSPLVRARQTAELLVEGLKLPVPLVLAPGFEPDDDPSRSAAILGRARKSVAVVGHEPHLGVLAALMTRGAAGSGIYCPFHKAGVLALSRTAKRWTSEWLVRAP